MVDHQGAVLRCRPRSRAIVSQLSSARENVETLLAQVAGSRVTLELLEPDPPAEPDAGSHDPDPADPRPSQEPEPAMDHPAIRYALELFQAKPGRVRPKTRHPSRSAPPTNTPDAP